MHRKFIASLLNIAIISGLFFCKNVLAASPEYVMNEQTAPDSAKDIQSPLGYGFLEKYTPVFVFKWLREEIREELEELPPFFRDTVIKMNIRTYYFNRDNDPKQNIETLAMGGSLKYRSGWAFDLFRIGTTLYTSQKLYGPEDLGGSLLLEPIQHGFTALGEAYVDVKLYADTYFRGYRQTFDYPYLNKQDSRMVPNTFEAYVVRHELKEDLDWIYPNLLKMRYK